MSEAAQLTRCDFAFDLVAITPLHIGAGTERRDLLDPVKGPDGVEKRPLVSAIQRDAAGCPWLPGTALKGALRALDAAAHTALFGEIKHSDTDLGVMGALLVRGAAMSAPGCTQGLPIPRDAAGLALAGDGVYVAARTAIHPGLGISEPNKLFHAEMVAPGARFRVRLRLETRGDAAAQEAALLALLSAWTLAEGVAVGADAASGMGRLRLDGDVTRTPWSPDEAGALMAEASATQPLAEAADRVGHLLRLTCEGPFLTRDPTETARGAGEDQPPQIAALRLAGAPFITGQALSGALRARFAWLCALEAHRTGGAETGAVKRLFGALGWRGVLTVMVEKTSSTEAAQTTSVRIDRFSGGVIDNALFTVDADLGASIDLRLMLDRRATAADNDALRLLVADLKQCGLSLGHGASRGYGWFTVKEQGA